MNTHTVDSDGPWFCLEVLCDGLPELTQEEIELGLEDLVWESDAHVFLGTGNVYYFSLRGTYQYVDPPCPQGKDRKQFYKARNNRIRQILFYDGVFDPWREDADPMLTLEEEYFQRTEK